MKALLNHTITKLIALSLILSICTTQITFAATPKAATLEAVKANINKINVSGNVEIILTQGNNESISYANESLGTAKIIKIGNSLNINSNGSNKVILNITIKDLYRINASDDAIIETTNEFNVLYLQVFLKDNAKANINSNTEGLYTIIMDNADLKLSGSTEKHDINIQNFPKLAMEKLKAKSTSVESQYLLSKL